MGKDLGMAETADQNTSPTDRHRAELGSLDGEPVTIKFDAAPKPPQRVRIRDVAKEAGVSVATVSMVLNENPRISRATHISVQRVIDNMGYRPNRLAQGLSSRYTRALAVMLPPLRHAFADAYFGELVSGIADRAGKLGHKLLIEQAKPQFIKEAKHIELYERRFVDGVLCLGFNEKHTFLTDLRQYPMILVDNRFSDGSLDYIHSDYRMGAKQAMNCLLQLGHRNIGMIYAAPESPTARDVMDVLRMKVVRRRRSCWSRGTRILPPCCAAMTKWHWGPHVILWSTDIKCRRIFPLLALMICSTWHTPIPV